MNRENDYRYMARALAVAARGLYTTDPNPRVGCVLVRAGQVVGEGWHYKAGEPHAEINALRQAGEQARGSTCYVTLEPCNHHGRTPPCTHALREAGVKRVVTAMVDPNPQVAGTGLQQLRDVGMNVESGLLQDQAEALNPGFCQRMRFGRPFMRCKLGMSLDGRTAMASGQSQWITGPAARGDVQRLRAHSSAIITGVGTLQMDDPSLTVRDEALQRELQGELRQPLRVVVDTHLRTPSTARMLGLPGKTLIATAAQAAEQSAVLENVGAEVITLPLREGWVDLSALLEELARREVNEALVEAGATLSGAMLRAGLIDEVVIYMAAILMGDGARGLFHLPGLETLEERIELDIRDLRAVGKDWRITATVK
jgi:diaminohydroxyphosphoribosylaminopyrimidine deaminase/5-amino-6-(5-phosphoribosylamino)uracil reductase